MSVVLNVDMDTFQKLGIIVGSSRAITVKPNCKRSYKFQKRQLARAEHLPGLTSILDRDVFDFDLQSSS